MRAPVVILILGLCAISWHQAIAEDQNVDTVEQAADQGNVASIASEDANSEGENSDSDEDNDEGDAEIINENLEEDPDDESAGWSEEQSAEESAEQNPSLHSNRRRHLFK